MYDVITGFMSYLSFPGEEKLITFIFINVKAMRKKKKTICNVLFISSF